MSDSNVLLSVIIPVFNAEKYLLQTFDALDKQTIFDKLEIILVNDGSTDSGKQLCENYIKTHENAILINQDNIGVSGARNAGLKSIHGRYVTFLDADDYIDSDLYEKELDLIMSNNAEIAIVDFKKRFSDGSEKKYRSDNQLKTWNSNESILRSFFSGEIGGQVVDKIFLTSALKKDTLFPSEYKVGEDAYFLYLFLKGISRAVMDSEIAGYYYIVRDCSAMTGTFSSKHFDSVILSEIMYHECKDRGYLADEAEAHFIHETCKALEYAYKLGATKEFGDDIRGFLRTLRRYPIKKAKKYLVKRQFFGFILMRFSPSVYLFFHKLLRIG